MKPLWALHALSQRCLTRSVTSFALGLAAVSSLGGCVDSCGKPNVTVADGSGIAAPGATTQADASPLNATPIPTASVAKLVNPQKLPAYVGPTGSVEGTIFVTGDPAPAVTNEYRKGCDAATDVYGKGFREGPGDPSGPRWLADAVVAITGYANYFVPEKDEAEEVTIEGCAYAKRTVTMTYGQRLEIKNLSKDFWTPTLAPGLMNVMMMASPGGDPVKLYPRNPGRFLVGDHDRKYANIDLFVMLHPLHTSSGLNGTYRIDGIPVGKVKVNTTHPTIESSEASKEIEIQTGVIAKVDLTLRHTARPTPPPDAGAPSKVDAGYYPRVH